MTTTTAASAEARRRLAHELTEDGALLPDSPWRHAFTSVPREVFVPRFTLSDDSGPCDIEPHSPDYLSAVYRDTTLTIRRDGNGTPVSSSSQPSLMARMLEAFSVSDHARVLEIGTGTGYNTALLCHRLGATRVTTIDIDPELTVTARRRLAQLGHAPRILTGDGTQGASDGAPYDGILATCGVDRLPAPWARQVRPGGLIVTNIGNGVARLIVGEDGTAEGRFLPDDAMFMRARPEPGHLAPAASQFTPLVMNGTGTRRTEGVPVPADEVVHATAHEIWMLHHDVLAMSFTAEQATTVHALVHPPTGSWARVTPESGDRVMIEHSGPRDLWKERLILTTSWVTAGRPGPGAYALSVASSGKHVLSRTEASPRSWTL